MGKTLPGDGYISSVALITVFVLGHPVTELLHRCPNDQSSPLIITLICVFAVCFLGRGR